MTEKPPIFRGVINQFPRAMEAIAKVSLFGANKYNNGDIRFDHLKSPHHIDSELRHAISIAKGEEYDEESGEPHRAHKAWRACADLELWLIEKENEI